MVNGKTRKKSVSGVFVSNIDRCVFFCYIYRLVIYLIEHTSYTDIEVSTEKVLGLYLQYFIIISIYPLFFCCFMGAEMEFLEIGDCNFHKNEQDQSLTREYKNRYELD